FLLILYGLVSFAFAQPRKEILDFDAQEFKDPSPAYGPYTRWWWPGNDVGKRELKREIRMFADNGFAGVEIQPLTVGIDPDGNRTEKVYSWDTPSFYDHIKTVMKAARKSGLTVDLNAGSGWPLGGPFIEPNESLLTLTMSD